VLYFREHFEVQDIVVRLMYASHYQGSDEQLIFRYDDTPHHSDLPQFPHPKHAVQESNVIQSNPPDLKNVLTEIEQLIPWKGE
jgi:hypothetical protein